MINPIASRGSLRLDLVVWRLPFIGGDSRADKRAPAVARTDANTIGGCWR